jgi:hypothetical protein
MAPLRLADHSLVLPADGVLHVLGRRGVHDLKGRQVDRLHERLVPYLHGAVEEEELVRAVPAPQAAAVRSYLAGLREAGALADPAAEPPPADPESVLAPLDALSPGCTRVRFRAGTRTAEVDIGGAAAPDSEAGVLRVCFVSTAQVRSVLLAPAGPAGRTTYVVVEDGTAVEEGEAELRAAYARWLLRNELDVLPDRDRFRLFRLDSATGELERLALVEDEDVRRLRTLPEQLGVVRAAEVDQIPLVVATATHPLLDGRVTTFGTSVAAAQRHCLRAFLARVLLSRGAGTTPVTPLAGRLGEPRRSWVSASPWKPSTKLAVAACRLELLLELGARWAERRAEERGVSWQSTDLLRVRSSHPATTYLQEVLRMRLPALSGEIACGEEGVFLVRAGAHRGRSFVRSHALAEVLLRAAWEVFYGGCRVPGGHRRAIPACSPLDFEEPGELRRVLGDRVVAMARRAEPAALEAARLRCWGVSAWVGRLVDRAGAGEDR